jgi:predicted SAM-dependent methyltransferase
MHKRLHLGSGRLEKLDPVRLEKFLTQDWINMGDIELNNPHNRPLQVVDYSRTNFIPFLYKSRDILPFGDKCLSFIFSEHFFEHLFLGEAISLFKECYRVLIDGGIIRVVVPDADLRPVPERLGFPSDSIGYDCPEKHKTRWSIYSLSPALEVAGFKINPIRYYDVNKVLHDKSSNVDLSFYGGCPDTALVRDFSIIKRHSSLIVDGVKWD